MTGTVLYRKWRSQRFAEVVGQEHVTTTLLNALALGRVAHAYLFGGPRGTGKTSTGRILAKAVNCLTDGHGEPCNTCRMCQAITEGHALDLIEIDAASNTGVDDVRELRERVNYAPTEARYKVYIIDEVHMLSTPAFNALLKTLEEPPAHAIFVLATTEVHKVPLTVISRCQRFDFRRIPLEAMMRRLEEICQQEGFTLEDAALSLLAKTAEGSLRDAENLLDQLVALYGPSVTLAQARSFLGITGDERAGHLVRHILTKELTAGLQTINAVAADGIDLRPFCREVVAYLRGVLLVKGGNSSLVDVPSETLAELETLAQRASWEGILAAIKGLSQADLRYDGLSPLPLELALVETVLSQSGERRMTETDGGKVLAPPAQIRREDPVPPLGEERRQQTPEAQAQQGQQGAGPPSGPETASPPAPRLSLGDNAGLQELAAHWDTIAESVQPINKNIAAWLRACCKPVALEGNTVVLGFYWSVYKDKVEEPRNRQVVEAALSRVLGAPHQVRCTITPREQRRHDAPAEAGAHLVRAALEMGGRIAEESLPGKEPQE